MVANELALSNLGFGRTVIVDCVNPVAESRKVWGDIAQRADVPLVNIQVICSDRHEHRRRVETRAIDIPGLTPPTWQSVLDHEYEAWGSAPFSIDTAMTYAAQAVMLIAQGGFSAHLWSETGLLSASECDLPAACQLRLRAGWQPPDCTPMRPPVRDRAVSDRLSLALVVRYWPISVIEA